MRHQISNYFGRNILLDVKVTQKHKLNKTVSATDYALIYFNVLLGLLPAVDDS